MQHKVLFYLLLAMSVNFISPAQGGEHHSRSNAVGDITYAA